MPKDITSTNNDEVLSPKERDVLHLVRHGRSTAEIATIMDISPRTVKFHVGNIMGKLNAINRTHAVAIALDRKLIEGKLEAPRRQSAKKGRGKTELKEEDTE